MKMHVTTSFGAAFAAAALSLLLMGLPTSSYGTQTAITNSDIDLFLNSPGSGCSCANVVIFIDNSSHWNTTYAPADGSSNTTKFAEEISALNTVISGLPSSINVGIMMGSTNGTDAPFGLQNGPITGGSVRFAVRPMTATNKANLLTFLNGIDAQGDAAAPDTLYTLSMHEVYAYFGGQALYHSTAWSPPTSLCNSKSSCKYYNTAVNGSYFPPYSPGGDINDPTPTGQVRSDDGTLRYGKTNSTTAMGDTGAYTTSATTVPHVYKSPLTATCSRAYMIFVSNGKTNYAENNNTSATGFNAHDMMVYDGADTTQIKLGADSLAPTISYSGGANGEQQELAPEYARFMYNTNSNPSISGQTNIITYTVNPWPASPLSQDYDEEIMLEVMAAQGHGKYFRTTNTASLVAAFNQIFAEVNAVNSVFAAAALPVSANVRGTNLNQVYLGVFRPDGSLAPRWYGNLKMYNLTVDPASNTLVLTDSAGAPAANSTTGFISPNAISFWTTASTFWGFRPATQNGVGGASDSPDGDLVEKGAEAEVLRTVFATTQSTRNLYTCTAGCTSGSALSATPFNASNTALNATSLGVSDPANLIAWVQGTDNYQDENQNGSFTDARASIHGDVLHSQPGIINYNRHNDNNDVYAFYGANDGVFHAVQGGEASNGGTPQWGFIPPEFFSELNALRINTPTISATAPKPYFFDGPVTSYVVDTDNDASLTTTHGDVADIFLTARRGGSLIYALNVISPSIPVFMWKATNAMTGFSEMGQTWSTVKIHKIHALADPVAIFGGGYDNKAEDQDPAGTDAAGRAIYVVDAYTGALLWEAGPSPSGASYNTTVTGMTHSIPSDIAVYDSTGDGYADRLYVGDTGGNVWRVDISDPSPANWKVTELASLGGTGTDARKFLYAPDVVYNSNNGNPYDAVLLVSGDREHPYNTTVVNRAYMIEDTHALLEPSTFTTLTEANLFDATADVLQTGTAAQQAAAQISLSSFKGWKLTLQLSGEKGVSGVTTIAGTVVFNTYSPVQSGSCSNSLGTATQYLLDYTNATANQCAGSASCTIANRSITMAGGGFVPTPVPVAIKTSTGKIVVGTVSGTNVMTFPSNPGSRIRIYWKKND